MKTRGRDVVKVHLVDTKHCLSQGRYIEAKDELLDSRNIIGQGQNHLGDLFGFAIFRRHVGC